MKKILAILMIAFALGGCGATMPEKTVVVETKYVVRTALDEQKAPPVRDAILDIKPTTDSELALWISAQDEYTTLWKKKFNELILFYEKPIE